MTLKHRIEQLFDQSAKALDVSMALKAVNELRFFLNQGEIRAAKPSASSPSGWATEDWVRKGILLCYKAGEIVEVTMEERQKYFEKSTLPLKKLRLEDEVRYTPGGSAIRDGVFLGKNVVIMPPSYINIGAFIDDETLIDSNSLIGTCAQIGKRVHIGAGTQIGGVLEPVTDLPVIVEDDVFISGNCGVFEGTILKSRAVIAAGVNLSSRTPVYDIVKEQVYRATNGEPLIIPEGAVVVPGMRHLDGAFAKQHQLSVNTPLIVKYRDEKTDAATALEDLLR